MMDLIYDPWMNVKFYSITFSECPYSVDRDALWLFLKCSSSIKSEDQQFNSSVGCFIWASFRWLPRKDTFFSISHTGVCVTVNAGCRWKFVPLWLGCFKSIGLTLRNSRFLNERGIEYFWTLDEKLLFWWIKQNKLRFVRIWVTFWHFPRQNFPQTWV